MDIEQPELFDQDDLKRAAWAAFDAATSEDAAREAFQQRYSRRPSVVKRAGPVVLAGPIPERERG